MTLRQSLVSQILDNVRATSITDVVNLHIDRAIDHYRSHRFWFNEGWASFSTSTSQFQYTLSTVLSTIPIGSSSIKEYLDIDQVIASQNKVVYTIPSLPIDKFLRFQTPFATSNIPSYYSIYKGILNFYPTPAASFSVRVYGSYQLTLTNSRSASNVWTTEAGQLIVARACLTLLRTYLMDQEMWQNYRQEAQEELDRLLRETRIKLTQGEISGYFPGLTVKL